MFEYELQFRYSFSETCVLIETTERQSSNWNHLGPYYKYEASTEHTKTGKIGILIDFLRKSNCRIVAIKF